MSSPARKQSPSVAVRELRLVQLLVMLNLIGLIGLGVVVLRAGGGAGAGMRASLPGGSAGQGALEGDQLRDLASRLRASGLLLASLPLYERYLAETDSLGPNERAALLYELGAALIDEGHHEEGLVWLYRVDLVEPEGEHARAAQARIVRGLEALGRYRQAAFVRDRATSAVDTAPTSGEGDERGASALKTVATIGVDRITLADVEEAAASLPPELAAQVASGPGLVDFARQYVAREVLYRKAVREGLPEQPEVRRDSERALQSAVVDHLIRREIQGELEELDEDELRTWFTAHRSNYPEDASFESLAQRVANDYAAEKQGLVLQRLVEEAMQADDVRFYDEALREAPPPRLPGLRRRPSLLGGGG